MPLRMPVSAPNEACRRQVHALLSPYYEGSDHRVRRGLSDGRPATGGPEESQRSSARIPADQCSTGPEARNGDRRKSLLQRPRRLGEVAMANLPDVQGFMYPNEIELTWSVLIVLYPFLTGLVAGAFILASLARVFRISAVQPI